MSQYVGYATIRENYSTSLIIEARSLGIEGILYRLFSLLLFFSCFYDTENYSYLSEP